MSDGPAPAEVTAAARALVGVRYRHQGRHRGNGLDCIGLLVLTARAVGVELEDYSRYPVHGDPRLMRELLDGQLRREAAIDTSASGEGQWWSLSQKRHERHLLYFTGTSVIQSSMEAGKVSEHGVDEEILGRAVSAWRLVWRP